IAPVAHVLGLAKWRGDRARVEVIASDDDRRAYLATRDEIVDALAKCGSLAIAEPANPCRQALERHALPREPDPTREDAVLREKLEDQLVGAVDVGGIPGQRHPSERTPPLGEERTDVRRNESRIAERLGESSGLRFAAQVVAVVERDGTAGRERDYRFAVARDRCARPADMIVRIVAAERASVGDARGYVAIKRIVRACLVRDDVHLNPAANELRQNSS